MVKIIIATVVALTMFVAEPCEAFGQSHASKQQKHDIATAQLKLNEFYRILTQSYIDTISYGKIVDRGIVSMLAELDPHSRYLTADEMKQSRQSTQGSFSGIGVEFNIVNDTITVINTITGGPAERVGVMPNDRIISIDGVSSLGIKRNDVPNYLRGAKDRKVSITVFRRSSPDLLDFTITRGNIPLNTVDAAYKVDDQTGYIKVNRFANNTMAEFTSAFEKFGEIEGLILDLRGNGGGLLPQALYMSEFFLNKGDVIVSTEGNLDPSRIMKATKDGQYNKGRLIILIDENSASASEIVSGAVEDWDRGILVGRPTFGKGLIQRQFDMSDGSGLRITISRYLTPTGRAIQRPYEQGHKDEYYAEHLQRYGAMPTDSSETSGPVYHTLKTKRPVYSRGGIRPDIHVPADTTGYSVYRSKLMRSGVIFEFVQSYLDDNRERMVERYPDFINYASDENIADRMVAELTAYAAAKGIEPDEEGLATSHDWLAAQLKALVAQRLWDTTAYHKIIHSAYDVVFKKAYEVMLRWYGAEESPVSEKMLSEISK